MRWTNEDTPEQQEFRAGFRSWLHDNLPAGWMEAADSGDDEKLEKLKAGSGFNPFTWQGTIGRSPYAAPLWPEEFGGLSGEVWMQTGHPLGAGPLPAPDRRRSTFSAWAWPAPRSSRTGPRRRRSGTCARSSPPRRSGASSSASPARAPTWRRSRRGRCATGTSGSSTARRCGPRSPSSPSSACSSPAPNPDVPKHEGLSYFILDMKSPGVDVRPLKQMTGSSEFNEVFLTDVRIPDANRVGDVGDGWRCARTTLMNERVALAGISLDPVSFTGGVRRDPWQSYLEGIPDRTDPSVRQRLAQFYIESEVKEITAFRANSARLRGQQPGPEGSVNKVFNAEYNQRRSNFAVDANGIAATAWLPGDTRAEARATTFLRARANTIEGGTSEVLRNQMAERILGLPRDVEVDKDVAWAEVKRS